MKKLNSNTWCSKDIKAGVILADILNQINDGHLSNKVGNILHDFDIKMKELSKLNNFREYYLKLTLRETENFISTCNFSKPVETHLLNIIKAKYRNILKIKKINPNLSS